MEPEDPGYIRYNFEYERKRRAGFIGAIGTLHMPGGGSGTSPLERLEVVGQHANIVVDNGVKVTYDRPAARPAYGRYASYMVDNDAAPLVWESAFSLGQLYNTYIFYLGYVQEVLYYCTSVLTMTPPAKGTLVQSPQTTIKEYKRMEREAIVRSARNETPVDTDWGRVVWLVGEAQMPGAEQTFGVLTIEPGKWIPLHQHPNCEELIYVTEGEADLKLVEEIFHIPAGDVIRIPRGVPHWVQARGDTSLVTVISFSTPDPATEWLEDATHLA